MFIICLKEQKHKHTVVIWSETKFDTFFCVHNLIINTISKCRQQVHQQKKCMLLKSPTVGHWNLHTAMKTASQREKYKYIDAAKDKGKQSNMKNVQLSTLQSSNGYKRTRSEICGVEVQDLHYLLRFGSYLHSRGGMLKCPNFSTTIECILVGRFACVARKGSSQQAAPSGQVRALQ